MTYQELNQRASRLAARLVREGVGPESLVALCAERDLPLVIAILAIFKTGGAYLPLDASHPPRRLAHILSI